MDQKILEGARAEIKAGLARATPGEVAIIGVLMIISQQLDALYAVQAKHAEQFDRVTAGGNAMNTEVAS